MREPGYELDGAKLKAARLAARLTAEELGVACGLKSGWTIRALERNSRGASFQLVRKLEQVLGVTAAQLGANLPDPTGR